MSRSYLVNLLVEVHVEDRDWERLEEVLEQSFHWGAFHDEDDVSPYVISAEVESYVEVIEGVADHG